MVEKIQICSAGRSGSTLLDLVLGSHSEIISLGEISHLPKNLALNSECSCGSPLLECAYWTSRIVQLEKLFGYKISENPYRLNLGYHVASREIDTTHQTRGYLIKRKISLIFAYLGIRFKLPSFFYSAHQKTVRDTLSAYGVLSSGRQYIVDSSKAYIRALSIYKSDSSQPKVILLVRNGLSVLASRVKDGYDELESIRAWKIYYKRALPLIKKTVKPEHLFVLKYEDLASSPESTLRELCQFVGVSFEDGMLSYAEHEHHILNGNNMRKSPGREIRLDLSWKKVLTNKNIDLFEKEAGDLNRQLGY